MDTFKSMSDLVADAQDLLSTIGKSHSPEVQALKRNVEASIDYIKEQARQQIRAGSSLTRRAASFATDSVRENPVLAIALGTAIAVATAYFLFFSPTDDA